MNSLYLKEGISQAIGTGFWRLVVSPGFPEHGGKPCPPTSTGAERSLLRFDFCDKKSDLKISFLYLEM